MAITTATDLANMQRIIIAEARFREMHTGVMRGVVERFTLPKGAKSIYVNRYTSATANALTDGVDMADSHTLDYSNVELTTSEVGLKVIVTDKLIRQNADDVIRSSGKILGDAMGTKFDVDLLALFDGFSLDTVPGTGQPVEMEDLAKCVAELRANSLSNGGPAPDPISCVLHPYGIYDIVSELTTGVWGALQIPHGLTEDVVKGYFRGKDKLWGIPIFEDGNITIDSTPNAIGGLFSKFALCYCMSKEWDVERERDASLRAWELVIVADYGVKELVDRWGCELKHDATALVS